MCALTYGANEAFRSSVVESRLTSAVVDTWLKHPAPIRQTTMSTLVVSFGFMGPEVNMPSVNGRTTKLTGSARPTPPPETHLPTESHAVLMADVKSTPWILAGVVAYLLTVGPLHAASDPAPANLFAVLRLLPAISPVTVARAAIVGQVRPTQRN